MTVVTAPVGWATENTECTAYVEQTTTKGMVHRLRSRFGTTSSATEPAGGIALLASADTPGEAVANDGGHIFGVALEDAAQYAKCRYLIRGVVTASVWQDLTVITEGMSLCLAVGDVAGGGANSLMSVTDIDVGPGTISPSGRKILAECLEAGDGGSAVVDLVLVLFNGAEGFGTSIGFTPA